MRKLENALAGAFCGTGLIFAGWLLSQSINLAVKSRQTVVVKGLSEKTVRADMVNWPIAFKVTGDNLSELQTQLSKNRQKVKDYLASFGFSEKEEISDSPTSVIDYYSQTYGERPVYRYLLQTTVLLRSSKVDAVKKAMGATGKLISQGVMIEIPQYGPIAEFSYTQLNTIKPDMLQESTKNARQAAEQFARDSNAQIGSIKSAQQGLFSISDRDTASPDWKNIRVVSTVEFFLQ